MNDLIINKFFFKLKGMKNQNISKRILISFFILQLVIVNIIAQNYPIVSTGQEKCYNNTSAIPCPDDNQEVFYGQDGNFNEPKPSYKNNGNGTITDNITGLMWTKSPDLNGDGLINYQDKLTYNESVNYTKSLNIAGFNDWRLPTIKELYSLIMFDGIDPSGYEGSSTSNLVPFIDTDYFDFDYGDLSAGERIIDAQFVTSTIYVSTTMMGDETVFGVNFADGRIKGYGTGPLPGQSTKKKFYAYFVRGNSTYGINDFHNNENGTITDKSTGLMWMQDDNGKGVFWQEALKYANDSEFAGYSDWRLPSVKELQSIVDYSRAPDKTNSASINPIFNCSEIIDESGKPNYPFYWSSTTHANWSTVSGANAAYVCFGEALGWMQIPPNSGNYKLLDVHGAGSQRSDPKIGSPSDFPYGHGPQGDVIRIYNYVRLVRNINDHTGMNDNINLKKIYVYPNPVNNLLNFSLPSSGSFNAIITDISGKLMKENFINNTHTAIDISELTNGLYLYKINDLSGKTLENGKFIKN